MPSPAPPTANSLRCPTCRYTLTDLKGRVHTCPECGSAIDWNDPALLPLRPRRLPWCELAIITEMFLLWVAFTIAVGATSNALSWIASITGFAIAIAIILTSVGECLRGVTSQPARFGWALAGLVTGVTLCVLAVVVPMLLLNLFLR